MSSHRFSYNSLQPSTFALIFIGDSGSHPVILSGGAACAYPPAQPSTAKSVSIVPYPDVLAGKYDP
jgi:hypothetical protein